jgi:hypothetical protein
MKTIVTTTIYPPSKAMLEFVKKDDWNIIIVGDKKTPHEAYFKLRKEHSNVKYLSPDLQGDKYKTLSDSIGWNCIQRRSIGFVEAYLDGAEIVASVDDDNIPYDRWGKNCKVGQTIDVLSYTCVNGVFDPLSATNHPELWHRGYPLTLKTTRDDLIYKMVSKKVLIQADLWDGDPDIDAMTRIVRSPSCYLKYEHGNEFIGTENIAPFNSQNTFIHWSCLKYYSILPHVGRADDIWAAYILQHHVPNSLIFGLPSVYQDRNNQDLLKNLEDEIFSYRNTPKLLNDLPNYMNYLPDATKRFVEEYRSYFD